MVEQLNLFAPDTLASLSPTPGSEKARKMTATSGWKCLGLCGSLGPLGSLEKMLLDTSRWASTMYFLTWKVKATKQGHLYYQLQPSKPRTEETGYSSWATPNTMDSLPQRSPEALIRQATTTRKGRSKPANLREQVDPKTVKLWATPSAADSVGSHGGGQGRSLRTDISNWKKGLWPTPTASETTARKNIKTNEKGRRVCKNGGEPHSIDLATSVKMWPTPVKSDFKRRGPNSKQQGLPEVVKMWPTPNASDHRDRGNLSNPCIQNRIEKGKQLELSMVVSDQSGQLNPDWVEALMGFPIGWTNLEVDEPGEHWIDNPRWPAAMGQKQYDWEPPRIATGVKNRVDRLKACGNAVSPAQVFPLLEGIKAVHEANQYAISKFSKF